MKNRVGLCLVGAIVGAVACGGASQTDFGDPITGSGHGGASGSGGTGQGGTTGGSATGGTSGTATGGSGAMTTGGSANGGTGGDAVAVGGTAGDLMATGGMAGEPMGTGGTAGDVATGGTAGDVATGGTAGDVATGGTDPGTGGAGNAGGMGGMATGGSAGKPSTGGTGGMPDCEGLAVEYAETLRAAQACNASSGKDQCTDLVPGSFTCGCDVYVNPSNMAEVAQLTRLRKQGFRCTTVCPAIDCFPPEGASCIQDVDGAKGEGHCVTALGGLGPI